MISPIWTGVYASILMALAPISLAAENIDSAFMALTTQPLLTDTELAEQRGRYIENGQAYYFGLLMQTQYLDHAGVSQKASMQVEIRPQGLVVTVADQGLVSGEQASPEVYGQESGLQQRIQIAGENNSVGNDFRLGSGQLAPLAQGQTIALGQVLQSQDGQRQYSAVAGQFGMQVQLGQNQSQQMLLNQNGGRQLLQMAQISGSHFQIFNTTQLHVSGISFGRLNSSMLAQQLLGNNFHGQ